MRKFECSSFYGRKAIITIPEPPAPPEEPPPAFDAPPPPPPVFIKEISMKMVKTPQNVLIDYLDRKEKNANLPLNLALLVEWDADEALNLRDQSNALPQESRERRESQESQESKFVE